MRYKEPYSLIREKRKNGIVYYYRFYDETGKRNKRSTGQVTRAKAHKFVLDLLKQGELTSAYKDVRAKMEDEKKRITFYKFTEDFYVWGKCKYILDSNTFGKGISQEHARISRSVLEKHLRTYFKNKVIRNITSKDIKDFILYLKEKKELKDTSINHVLKILKVVLTFAVREGVIQNNPINGISRIRAERKSRGILTIEEIKKLFDTETAFEVWDCAICYTFNLFGALTGCRRGEIIGLLNKYVHDDYVEIKHSWGKLSGLKPTKTKENRIVPIPGTLSRLLKDIVGKDGEGFVFSFDGGVSPFPEKLATKSLYSALAKIGINKDERERRYITFHSFRHFFNTYCRANNITDDKVRAVTGHKTLEVADGYTHFTKEDYKEVSAIQDSIL